MQPQQSTLAAVVLPCLAAQSCTAYTPGRFTAAIDGPIENRAHSMCSQLDDRVRSTINQTQLDATRDALRCMRCLRGLPSAKCTTRKTRWPLLKAAISDPGVGPYVRSSRSSHCAVSAHPYLSCPIDDGMRSVNAIRSRDRYDLELQNACCPLPRCPHSIFPVHRPLSPLPLRPRSNIWRIPPLDINSSPLCICSHTIATNKTCISMKVIPSVSICRSTPSSDMQHTVSPGAWRCWASAEEIQTIIGSVYNSRMTCGCLDN